MTTKQSRTETARSFITVKNVLMNFHTHIQMKAEKRKKQTSKKKESSHTIRHWQENANMK